MSMDMAEQEQALAPPTYGGSKPSTITVCSSLGGFADRCDRSKEQGSVRESIANVWWQLFQVF